jgi:glycerate kinase
MTGEGRVDGQSASGKVLSGVLAHASRHGIPVVVLAGSVRGDELAPLYHEGLVAAFPIVDGPMTFGKAIDRAAPLIRRSAEAVMRLWMSSADRRNGQTKEWR